MRVCVAHETVYRYDTPPSGVIQTLRMTPRNHDGQYVVDWRIDVSADCRLEANEDAFGNIVHAFSTGGPIEELRVLVEGEVETQDTAGVVRGTVERFPPSLFLRETPLTRADDAILAYARQFPRPASRQRSQRFMRCLPRCIRISRLIPARRTRTRPRPKPSRTNAGIGGFTHVFLAIVRTLGVPARFVSGYFRGADGIATKAKLSQVQTQGDQQSLQEMAQIREMTQSTARRKTGRTPRRKRMCPVSAGSDSTR